MSTEKFYDKFTEKKSGERKSGDRTQKSGKQGKGNIGDRPQKNWKKNESRKDGDRPGVAGKVMKTGNGDRPHSESSYKILNSQFNRDKVPLESQKIIENFDDVVQWVKPLNSRQLQQLPDNIKALSHQLTDQRSERRLGYMNENIQLSSYVRYYTWWNLIRLTRLFANLNKESFPLKDSVCLDVGSGPLTVVIALWLARPELRQLNLTWYCLDVSANSMAFGEDLYLSIAAKITGKTWKIIRVKGSFGTFIKEKADFITCANMLNELDQSADMPPEYQTKKYYEQFENYADENAKFLLIEPGIPKAARTLSLLRDRFIREGKMISSPCTHLSDCPMNGFKAYTGSQHKWCNFAFSTDDAPVKLLKLSDKAKLPKERATLCFISVINGDRPQENKMNNGDRPQSQSLFVKVISDSFHVPGSKSAFYCCSRLGLTLLKVAGENDIKSGDLISINIKINEGELPVDQKSGAVIISVR